MAFSQACSTQFSTDISTQLQQTQFISNGGLLFTNSCCHCFLSKMELFHQLLIAFCFFKEVQVFTLQVFNESNFRNLLGSIMANDNRNFFQLCHFGRTQATFPCNEHIIAIFHRSYQKRLQHNILSNGSRKICQAFIIKGFTGLVRVRYNFINIYLFNLYLLCLIRTLRHNATSI